MSKKLYSIAYRNCVGRMKYWDIHAYTVRQALFVFHKYVTDCSEIVQVNEC